MKFRKKSIGAICLILATMLVISGCSGAITPYQQYDAENYNVCVRFDANGGLFHTNLSVITDSYNITNMKVNGEGKVEIPLLNPNDELRGDIDSFDAEKEGYFLAGWYTERTEVGDGKYVYSGKWDFQKDRLEVDPNGKYSAENPVMTLYAAWIPKFTFECFDYRTGEYLYSIPFDPLTSNGLSLPGWSSQTGRMVMRDLEKRDGYTFGGVYLSPEDTEPVSTSLLKHCGTVDLENGTGSGSTMKLYLEWMKGDWYQVTNAKNFVKYAAENANLIIDKDIDFSDTTWTQELSNLNFTGTIIGNGHSITNLKAEYSGKLFASIGDGAQITDLSFAFAKGAQGDGLNMICDNISPNATLSNVDASVFMPSGEPSPASE